MTPNRTTWTCQTPAPVALAPSLVLRCDARHDVHLARGRSAAGTWVWRCSGGQSPPFAVEARGDERSALVTRPDGVPFGRLEVVGRLLPRIELHDHDRRRARVRRDGRVIDDARRTIARLHRDDDLVLEVVAPVDDTMWALLIAALLHLPTEASRPARPASWTSQ